MLCHSTKESSIRGGDDKALYDLPRKRREFNITIDRIVKYDPTPGCKACDRMNPPGLKHTDECVARFRQKMQDDGTLPITTIQTVTPVSEESAPKPVDEESPPPTLEEEEDDGALELFGDFETPVDEAPSSDLTLDPTLMVRSNLSAGLCTIFIVRTLCPPLQNQDSS